MTTRLLVVPEPGSGTTGVKWLHRAARIAEEALFDALIAPPPSIAVPAEPSTLLGSLAAQTNRLGLIAPLSTQRVAPYNRARYLSTLDHLSGGRAGWLLTDGDSYSRAAEFVTVLRRLWESWAPDAVRADTEAGVYVDERLLAPVHFTGEHFAVGGPLNLPRSPQLHPPMFVRADHSGVQTLADVVVVDVGAERPGGVPLVLREIHPVLDNPPSVAVDLAAEVRHGAVDGFVVHLTESGLDRFARDVIPRLQEAGLYRTRYESATLRGHLGLVQAEEVRL